MTQTNAPNAPLPAPAYYRFVPRPMTDRPFWGRVSADPRFAGVLAAIAQAAAAAPAVPPVAQATDFLAARRSNDRARVDARWQHDRRTLSQLAIHRCIRGLDDADDPQDDRLLNWLWGFLTEPTWVVSAHLPNRDLPALGGSTLDLAATEMAALLAEVREVLKPWMDSVSGTLADSIIAEIDRKILKPFVTADAKVAWWTDPSRAVSNWGGVCAGSVLAACRSLTAQGHPRPEAEARALAVLRMFADRGFTPGGECDEGMNYWVYGMAFASLGWSRLDASELAANVNMTRLAQLADYPRRAHLGGDVFFSGNDSGLRASPPRYLTPWLAAATGNPFLAEWGAMTAPAAPIDPSPQPASAAQWKRRADPSDAHLRHFGQILRFLAAPPPPPSTTAPTAVSAAPSTAPGFLEDQQTAIFRIDTPRGRLVACLSGGHNAERHNHNDVGHFLVTLAGRIIIPDLGAPHYTADFFGPGRYTYLTASSRGHCCPLINDTEQRAGREAAATVLAWEPAGNPPRLALECAAAYPPEEGLVSWTRTMEQHASGVTITDRFHTARPGRRVIHVIWSLEHPHAAHHDLRLGDLACHVDPPPQTLHVTPVNPKDHLMRDFVDRTLYRIEAAYETGADGGLTVTTSIAAS